MGDAKAGKFGEPWYRQGSDVRGYGRAPGAVVAQSANETTDRMIECVNSLSGIEKPGEYVKALEELMAATLDDDTRGELEAMGKVQQARGGADSGEG